jgi:hypothetical protein
MSIPRIQVTLDEQSSGLLSVLAAERHVSKSAMAALLIREALELEEDKALSALSERRLKQTKGWVSHADAWGSE